MEENPHLVSYEQLKSFTGYACRAYIIRWLEENEIKFRYGKDGNPITTVEQINRSHTEQVEKYEFG